MSDGKLRVVSVSVRDVLGAREFVMEPGRITLMEGANGSGKTTALAAIQAALGGGSIAKLARVDPAGKEAEPEVVLMLQGDGEETYRVERDADGLRVRSRVGDTAAFEDVRRPQEFLSAIFDAAGSSPVRFLTAPDKDRVLMALEAIDVKLDTATLRAEMGLSIDEWAAHAPSLPVATRQPFEALAHIRESVFRARTGLNTSARDKRGSAEQMRLNLPAKLPENATRQRDEAASAVENLAADVAREEETNEAAYRAAVKDAEHAHEVKRGEVWADFEAAAAEIRAKAEAQIAEHRQRAEEVEAEARKAMNAAKSQAATRQVEARAASAERREILSAARVELAKLNAEVEAASKARGLAEQADRFGAEAAELEARSQRLTTAIEALDAHRRRLLDALPIPGLTIDDKAIKVNGVPYDQLNLEQRTRIAVKIACLRAKGRLPLVFVDDAEKLDTEHFRALVGELEAQGVQAIVTRVADHELTVSAVS